MGDVTPRYGFPYPVGTDLLRDGDNAIQALAEGVETQIGANEDRAPFAIWATTVVSPVIETGQGLFITVTWPAGLFSDTPDAIGSARTPAPSVQFASVDSCYPTYCNLYFVNNYGIAGGIAATVIAIQN